MHTGLAPLLAEAFRLRGYRVTPEASLEGRSGTVYATGLLAEDDHEAIVLETRDAGEPLLGEEVEALAAILEDVGASRIVLACTAPPAPGALAAAARTGVVVWDAATVARLIGEAALIAVSNAAPSPLPLAAPHLAAHDVAYDEGDLAAPAADAQVHFEGDATIESSVHAESVSDLLPPAFRPGAATGAQARPEPVLEEDIEVITPRRGTNAPAQRPRTPQGPFDAQNALPAPNVRDGRPSEAPMVPTVMGIEVDDAHATPGFLDAVRAHEATLAAPRYDDTASSRDLHRGPLDAFEDSAAPARAETRHQDAPDDGLLEASLDDLLASVEEPMTQDEAEDGSNEEAGSSDEPEAETAPDGMVVLEAFPPLAPGLTPPEEPADLVGHHANLPATLDNPSVPWNLAPSTNPPPTAVAAPVPSYSPTVPAGVVPAPPASAPNVPGSWPNGFPPTRRLFSPAAPTHAAPPSFQAPAAPLPSYAAQPMHAPPYAAPPMPPPSYANVPSQSPSYAPTAPFAFPPAFQQTPPAAPVTQPVTPFSSAVQPSFAGSTFHPAYGTPLPPVPTPQPTGKPIDPATGVRGTIALTISGDEAARKVRDHLFTIEKQELLLQPVHLFDYTCDTFGEGSLKLDSHDGRIQVHGTDKKATAVDLDEVTTIGASPFIPDVPGATISTKALRVNPDRALEIAQQKVMDLHTRLADHRLPQENNSFHYVEKRKVTPRPEHIRITPLGAWYRPTWRLQGANGELLLDAVTGAIVGKDLRSNPDAFLVD